MSKFHLSVTVFLFFWMTNPLSIKAQSNDSTIISWVDSYKLTYDDFKGEVGKDAEVALTSSGFYFWYDYDGKNKLSVDLYAVFDKSKSWFREEGKVQEVLSHEQTHFDITELNVRLFRKALLEKAFRKSNNFDVMLPRIYNDYISKCMQMQNDYDNQTNHGIDADAQKGWDKKIAKLLLELNQYKSSELLFKVN